MSITRVGQFLLVGWLLLCVGMIVPAHNGAHAHAPLDEAHEHEHHDGDRDGHHHDHHPGEESDDAAHCSICQFAAGVTQPLLVDVNVQAPRLLEIVAAGEPASPASRQVILPFHGRAPPIGV